MRKTQQITRFKASPSHWTNSWLNGLWKTHIFLCEHIKKRSSMQILHFANELAYPLLSIQNLYPLKEHLRKREGAFQLLLLLLHDEGKVCFVRALTDV